MATLIAMRTIPGFLALEPLIAARIRSVVVTPGLKVLAAADLAGLKANAQPSPAVHVIQGGHSVAVDGWLATITETWLTVVAVRNVRDAATGAAMRTDAGPILDALFAGLFGWRVDGVKPLVPAKPPRPGFEAGFGYFPLAWEATWAIEEALVDESGLPALLAVHADYDLEPHTPENHTAWAGEDHTVAPDAQDVITPPQ